MSCVEGNEQLEVRYDSLVAALRDRAKRQPEKTACIFQAAKGGETRISFAELDRRARAVAVQLDMVAQTGDSVLILCQPGLDYISGFFGCLYAQMKAVPLYPPRNERHLPRMRAVAEDVKHGAVLTTADVLKKMERFSGDESWNDRKTRICIDQVSEDLADYWDEALPSCDTIAFLQYTSGSTGAPKGVMVSHANLCHNIEVIGSMSDTDGTDTHVVSWLPPYHDMGLIGGILYPAYNGFPSITMPPEAFAQNPFRWLETVAHYPSVLSPAPNFAFDLCARKVTEEQAAGLDLSRWRGAFCGSEPIRHQTFRDFVRRFARNGFSEKILMPCYGMAENTLLLTCGRRDEDKTYLAVDKKALELNRLEERGAADDNARILVGCGKAAGDQCVVICDPENGELLGERRIGEIWATGRSVAQGYWGRSQETEEAFRASIPGDARRYLRTGDLGFLIDGELFITGRIKDLMIVNGKNHYPQDVEATVSSAHAALVADGCAAFTVDQDGGEQVVIVAEVQRTSRYQPREEIRQAVRDAVARDHDLQVAELVLIAPATLPKTSSGKVQRSRTRGLYLAGELKALDTGTQDGDLATGGRTEGTRAGAADIGAMIGWIREYAETRINSRLMDERRSMMPHIVLDLGEQGLLGMQIPRRYGGLELSNEQALTLVEQLSAIDISVAAFVGLNNSLGIRPILHHANEALKAELLPRLAAGRMLASFAITEPGAGSDPRQIAATAYRRDDGLWSISGEKSWIGSSAWAGVISVFARSEGGGVTGFVVPQGTRGMRMGPEELTMGVRAMVQNTVFLDDARVPDSHVLGKVGMGMDIAHETMSMTRLGFGAIGLGGMRRCAQLMLRYATRRSISTGRLLDNAVTLGRLNVLTMRVHVLEAYVKRLVRCLDQGRAVPEETLMIAKILGTEYLFEASDDLMQLLGGRGYIETNMVPQLFRDARLTRIFEGPTETLNMHVGSSAVNNPGALADFIAGELRSPALAARLKDLVEEVKAQGANAGKLPERQWLYMLMGEAVQWILQRAVLENGSAETGGESVHARTLAWCELNLDRAVARARSGEGRMAFDGAAERLSAEILAYNEIIGDIEQSAAGEKTEPDDLLRRELRDGSPVASVSVTVPAADEPAEDEQTAQVRLWVMAWLQKHLRLEAKDVDRHTRFTAVGLDSIQAAELMMDLSDRFGVDVDMSAAWDYPTVQALANAVAQLLASNGSEAKTDAA